MTQKTVVSSPTVETAVKSGLGHDTEVACALDRYGCEVSVGSAVIDNACTMTVIGGDAIPYVRRRWVGPPVIVRTSNGASHCEEMGEVMTVYGLIKGYIVEESGFSLWSLDSALKYYPQGTYVQTEHDAYITFANGAGFNFEREGKLWVVHLYDNDYVPPSTTELYGLGGLEEPIDACAAEVTALATATTKKIQTVHEIQGHSVHDPDCEHCLMGRMKARARKRVSGPRVDQRAWSVYIDLMGPFEEDLLKTVN